MPGQPSGDFAHVRKAHEEHESAAHRRERGEVQAPGIVRGHRGDASAHAAMRHRDAGGRRHGAERGDARDDLERHAGRRERERLLPASPEDERVAALETDDGASLRAVRDEQRVDRLLRAPVSGDAKRAARCLGDELPGHEAVVDQHLARAQALQAPHRDQARVAGARADERNRHCSVLSTSRWKNSRRSS